MRGPALIAETGRVQQCSLPRPSILPSCPTLDAMRGGPCKRTMNFRGHLKLAIGRGFRHSKERARHDRGATYREVVRLAPPVRLVLAQSCRILDVRSMVAFAAVQSRFIKSTPQSSNSSSGIVFDRTIACQTFRSDLVDSWHRRCRSRLQHNNCDRSQNHEDPQHHAHPEIKPINPSTHSETRIPPL